MFVMFHLPTYVQALRKDRRLLQVHNAQLQRSHQLQKQKSEQLEKENTTLKRENEKLKRREQALVEELEKIKQERDSYKNMVFKAKRTCVDTDTLKKAERKRGGQKGHEGHGRKLPEE